MNYKIKFSKRAEKDYSIIKKTPLGDKARKIIKLLQNNPYEPPLKQLKSNLKGAYSKRLNLQHRIVYQIHEAEKVINIISMWTHYENI